jgi:hypothetical protein
MYCRGSPCIRHGHLPCHHVSHWHCPSSTGASDAPWAHLSPPFFFSFWRARYCSSVKSSLPLMVYDSTKRRLLTVVHRLQPACHLLDGEMLKVQKGFHRQSNLGVLLWEDAQVFLHLAFCSSTSPSLCQTSCYTRLKRRRVKSSTSSLRWSTRRSQS